jgi:predicted GNAT superfamily acetyltransferase
MASPSRTGRPIVAAALELDGAARAAEAAAGSAGVSVRELTDLADLDRAVELFSAIWGRSANPPMTVELLRAFAKAGNYVAGAVEATPDGERLVGACVGFFHAPSEDALHSHIAGVAPTAANRSVGFALKLHQRAWAMARGVGEVVWTYDPLVARNAHFNLVKLAARPAEYLPNFYGPLTDAINGDEDSDRLLVRWRLRDPAVVAACSGNGAGRARPGTAGAVPGLGVGADGGPRPGSLDGALSLVAVPPDIGRLRLADPAMAQRWRVAVREALTGLVGRGGRIEGFDRAVGYVVRRHR